MRTSLRLAGFARLLSILVISFVSYAAVAQVPGNALNFDGVNDYVTIADATSLKPATVTVEAWVRPITTTGNIPIVLKLNSRGAGVSNNESYSIYLNNGKFAAAASSSAGTQAKASQLSSYDAGRWYHVAAMFTSTSVSLYVNGVLQQTTATGFSLDHSTSAITIGGTSDFATLANFSMDEFRVFKTDRTAQVASDMANTINPLSNPNLVAYYSFEQGTAGGNNTALTTVTDRTSNANTGTLNGFDLTAAASSNFVESYAMVIPLATTASSIGDVGFTANWTAPNFGTVTNYALDVSTSASFSSFVTGYNGLSVAGTSQAITGLTSGVTYYYRVRADKASVTGQGTYSTTQSARTIFVLPSISYTSSTQTYTSGTAITSLSPTNTGGSVPATIYGQVTTLAGSSAGFQDGTGTASQLNSPYAMVSDGTNLYVADQDNHRIRKVVIATGVVTTLAGQGYNFFGDGTGTSAYFNVPRGLALDGAGNLYVADFSNHRIRKIVIATGVVTTIAGNGSSSTLDGNGTSASIGTPTGIVYDAGNLYVTSLNQNRVRKIVLSTNDVTTLAGSGSGSFADGTGTAASFNNPSGIATDGVGNLYVVDQNNNRIRKIVIATASVTTFAGNGSSGSSNGIGTSATFSSPVGIVFDGADNLYIADQSNHRIRKIALSTANVTSFNTANGSYTDGDLSTATFNYPTGLAMDGSGYLYIADQGNHRIRKVGVVGYSISPALPAGLNFDGTTGVISGTPGISSVSTVYTITANNNAGASSTTVTITVNPGVPSVSSFVPASAGAGQTVIITGTNFSSVTGVSFGGTPATSYTIISETSISAIVGSGTTGSVNVTTVLGSASLAGFTLLLPPNISFNTPQTYQQGTAIAALTPTNIGGTVPAVNYGTVSTLAGSSGSFQNGTGTSAYFNNPQGVVSDGTNIYVADYNNHVIRMIVIATGVTTTLAGSPGSASLQDGTGTSATFYYPRGLVLDGQGNLYVVQGDYYNYNAVRKIVIATGVVTTLAGNTSRGAQDGIGSNAYFWIPSGIAYDGFGNLYVADQYNHRIRKIVISTGVVTTLAGSSQSFQDGTGTAAYFNNPTGITYDAGNLYVADQGNNRIRKIVITSGVVTTLAGTSSSGSQDGGGTAARFSTPSGIAADGIGNLYVADQSNHKIRKIDISTGTVTSFAGTGNASFLDGAASTASFYNPYGIAVDGTGYLYVGDQNNHRIRKIGLVGYSISPTTLPPGLSFDATTGTISGTPTIGSLAAVYTVTGANNVGMDTAVVSITVIPSTPTITSFSPVSVGPNQAVTITGTNFSTVTAVSFGGVAAASYTVNSTTSITAILGAGADGSVSVTTTGGTATLAGFLVLTAPVISYATPQTYNQGTAITALTPTNTAGIIPPVNYGTVSTLAGSGSASSGNGTGTGASFYNPQGVVSDGTNVYVADYNNHTIRKIVIATGVTTTLAGSAGSGSQQDGTGTNAYFNYPRGLALDGAGNLYVTQGDYYYCGVRKIVISTGVVTTLAGGNYYPSSNDGTGTNAQFYNPTGIAYDGAGNLYVADQAYGNIRKIVIATGVVTTFSTGFGGPAGIAYDGGNLYVTERDNHRIRKIVISTNTVTTLAGSGSATFADGTGTAASFNSPNHITADGLGNLYVADLNNYRIRKIVISTGVVTTVAGNGTQTFVNGSSTTASFNNPNGIALDGAGYLYVGDQSNHRIRKIGLLGYSISPTVLPAGLSFDGTTGTISGTPTIGTLAANFVVTGVNTIGLDTANISIAVIPAVPTVTSFSPVSVGPGQSITITGTNFSTVSAVSFGGVAAASYTVNSTTSITAVLGAGADGSVSVTTTGGTGTLAGFLVLTAPSISYTTPQNYPVNTAITALVPTNAGGIIPVVSYGTVSTLAGSGSASSGNGTGTGASFNNPQGIVSDGTNIYVAEYSGHRILKIVIATGVTTTLAGSGGASMNDGTGTGASFYFPHGLALDGQGNLYVTQGNSSYSAIRKIVIATGVVTTLAGNTSWGGSDGTGINAYFYNPTGITYDVAGNLYIADQGNGSIRKIVIATGVVSTIATGIGSPTGIAYEGGSLYITERDYQRVMKFVISTSTLTTLAGSGSAAFADGIGTAASFYSPNHIIADGSGNLYVADQSNHRIRKIVIANGVVTTLAGNGSQTFVDGSSATASFSNPYGITLDGGYLYVGDQSNHRIRRIGLVGYTITPALPTGLSFASTTGTISGTPTIGSLPTNYVVTGVNSIGSDTANISIGIIPAAPTVTSFTPTSVGAGQSVTITGTNFVAVTGISFGGTDVASFTINSSISITAIVGAGSTGSVSVTTTGGTATLAGFTLLLSPVISYTTPQNYPINTAITALAPTNTGGAVPAVTYGTVSTLAGSNQSFQNGTGTSAYFNNPQGVISDGINIYVADYNNHRIRQIVIATGVTTTLAGSGSASMNNGTGTGATFYYPRGLALDGQGNLYVSQGNSSYSSIRKIVIATGVVTTLAGNTGWGSSDGTGTSASFLNPTGITYDGAGNLYVADQGYGSIRKVVIATGVVTTLVTGFSNLAGIAYDGGNLYVTEQGNQRIRKIVISTNAVTTFAGSGNAAFADGTGTAASFYTPSGITADGSGNLYVGDQNNHRIRKVVISTAAVTTIAGNGTATFVDGSSTTASFYSPSGIAVDGAGYLYVGDQNNHRIRKIGLVGYAIAPTLPTGLSFDGTTGTISGTPTVASLPVSYTVSAYNSAGFGSSTVSIAVVPAAPTITSFTPTSAPYLKTVSITGTNFAAVTGVSFGGTAVTSFTVNSTTSITAVVGSGTTGSVSVTTTGGTATLAGFTFLLPPNIAYATPQNYTSGTAITTLTPTNTGTAVPTGGLGTVSTLAGGSSAGSTNGTGTAASFNNPQGVVSDGTNIYVADYNNHRIRQIVIATGVTTTLAGSGGQSMNDGTGTSASFYYPRGLVLDGQGNLYVTQGNVNYSSIRKIVIATAVVTTLAGNSNYGNSDGIGTSATFYNPSGIAYDGSGNLYVADLGYGYIRKIVISTGAVTTFATGLGLMGIAYDAGNLYITEPGSQRIRKIVISTNAVTTLAGSGTAAFADGIGTAASFSSPMGIITDGTGNLYVSEQYNHRIRKINISTGAVTTVAGNGTGTFVDGSSTIASFNNPYGLGLDGFGYLYVADQNNNRIRQVSLNGYSISPALPTGLSFSTSTGAISGSATVGSLATDYTVTAYNANGTGTAIVNITVTATVPTIASFTPTTAGAGQTVTITGTNFSAISAVSFGGTAVASYTVLSTTTILAVIGNGTSGSVSVTNNGGIATLAGFTFLPLASIAYAGPQSYTAGTAITALAPTNTGGAVPAVNYGAVSTLAGSGTPTFTNGTGTGASFYNPQGVASDGTNIYVADFNNHRIRQIVIATGVTTTLAGSGSPSMNDGTGVAATFYYPRGLTLDGQGNLYVTQGNSSYSSIRKIVISTGVVTTLAGNTSWAFQDGTGTNAYFYNPSGIAYDGTGNLYVADQSNQRIRKIVISSGVVTTLAGNGSGLFADGTGTAAYFNNPTGITYDAGNLYVADQGNHRIRKIVISTGAVTTLAGSGSAAFLNGTGTAASFYSPSGITADGSGNLYVADMNNQRIRKIVISTAMVTTVAGNGTATFVDGSSTVASFYSPFGIALDGAGYLYVGDQNNYRIRKIGLVGYSISPTLPTGLSFDGTTGTISGTPTTGTLPANYTVTAANTAGINTATINIAVLPQTPTITSTTPTSVGPGQTITITGTNFVTVTAVSFGGTAAASYTVNSSTSITAILGAGSNGNVSVTTTGGTATLAGFVVLTAPFISYATPQSYPVGTAITTLSPTNTGGIVSTSGTPNAGTLAGSNGGFQNGTSTSAFFNNPQGVVSDGTNLYVADYNNHRIRQIVLATGVTTTLAGSSSGSMNDGTGISATFYLPRGLALDGQGNLYVSQGSSSYPSIRKIVIATGAVTTLAGNTSYGNSDGTGTNANFYNPTALAYDGQGNLYVADQAYGNIRKIVIATGVVTTFSTGFSNPTGIAYDGGNLYVTEQGNNRIRKIVISTNTVTTLAGSGSGTWTDGTGTAASFASPAGITADGLGNLYVADFNNHRIRKIVISTGVVTTLAGNGSSAFVDGTATAASFSGPYGIAMGGNGYLYVGDQYNHRIRKIDLFGYFINSTLPTGLSFDGTTGAISGTPTVGTLATNYTVTAANSIGSNSTVVSIATIPGTPTITSFTPTSAGAGQTVTITGTNFATVTAVSFGGTAVASYTVNSSTSITAVVGSGATGSVSVTTTGGTATLAGFTLLLPPIFTYAGPQTYNAGTAITALTPTNTGGAVPAVNYGTVSTLAGSGSATFTNGTGTGASFYNPQGVVSDGTNIYVADYNNHRIRQVVIATGATTTLAGSGSASMNDGTGTSATFYYPRGLVLDGAGNLYVSQGDYNYSAIRKIVIATGAVTTLAGSNSYGSSYDGTGSSAGFYNPTALAYDGQGNLYVADQAYGYIRKVVIATGVVTTFSTGFSSPTGIAYDGGNLYVTEQGNQRIRKIVISTNTVTTLAGSGSGTFADGTGTSASFYTPSGIASDGSGNLYVADLNNHRIRKIVISTGVVTTLAGNGTATFVDGSATTASFYSPYGIAIDAGGYLYIGDQNNQRIRKIGLVGYSIAPALPLGLSFDGTTGTISGTPTTGSLATTYTVTGVNGVGTGTATVSINVIPQTPTVTAFAPTSAGAGQSVTITGTNFTTVTGVSFGGTAVASYTVNSSTSITAILGAGATGSASVTTTGGTATLAGFTFLLPPAITYTTPQVYTTNSAITALAPTNTGGAVPAVNYGTVSTLAGSNGSFQNGTGTAAYFNTPRGVVSDGTNIYVADYNNHLIRKIVIATGVTTTLAGSNGSGGNVDGTGTNAYFNYPNALALDGQGNLYVTQGSYYYSGVRKIVIATGVVTTMAGGNYFPSSNDGTGTSASFYSPSGIAYDGAGNLYIADQSNHRIRKIVISTGVVTTIAGSGSATFSDGTGTSAYFYNPTGIAYDGGNLYVADQNNHRIRKIVVSTGVVTTLAGNASSTYADGIGTAANFNSPIGITADGNGNLYVADFGNHRIRKIVISTGVVTTLAGNGSATFVEGPSTTASFNYPYGIALDGAGYLYIGDQNNHRIRKIGLVGYSINTTLPTGLSFDGTTGIISGTPTVVTPAANYTVTAANTAGTTTTTVNISVVLPLPTITSFTPSSVGAGQTVIITGTGFTGASSVTFGGTPASYTVISGTSIRAVLGAGSSGSVVVITPGGTATLAGFTLIAPPSITYAGPQSYLTGAAITSLSPTATGGSIPAATYGATTTLAGSSSGTTDGTGTSASFSRPYGVTSDGAGNLYVADYYNHKIRKIVIATGVVTTVAGSGTDAFANGTGTAASFNYPAGIVADKIGNLYVADQLNNRIRKIVLATGVVTTLAGSGTDAFADGSASSANFSNPIGITTDGTNLYVADANNNRIRKIVISTGAVTTLAGSGNASFANGTGIAASFSNPSGITYDGSGSLFVADQYNNRVRKIVISSGVVTTLAGSGNANTTDGTGTTAAFDNPVDISSDGIGNVYVTDQNNNRIRKINTTTAVVTTVAGSSTGTTDATGTAAKFNSPAGIVADAGKLYVGDLGNDRIRAITVTGYNLNTPLPTGLVMNGETGTISGTPTVETAAANYSITASNAAGTSTSTVNIAVVAEPSITSFTPTSAAIGQTVTITGTNLTGVTSVNFGGTAATSFTVVSSTSITAVVAAGTSGSVSVVKAGITASLAGFTFLQPTASISGTTDVCLNASSPSITFTGANGAAPYTFTYTINNGSNLTVTTTSGSAVTVAAPTGTAGTFTYSLVSVADNATNSQAQTGSAVVTVNALPIITTQAITPICGALTADLSKGITSDTTGLTIAYYSNAGLTTAVANPVSTNGTYYIKVLTSSNCTASASVVVNAFKLTSSTPIVSATQPTCSTATATLTVTSSLAGLTFSNDGTTYTNSTGVFTVAAGSAYSITAKNSDGCISQAVTGTVNAQPVTPTTPVANVTQPTCSIATATITVTSTGASTFALVIDGTTFSNSTGVFNNIAAGSAYSVTTTSAAGCTSTATTGTVNAQPSTPTVPTVSVTQPTCATATATITVTSTLTGLTFSNDGTTYTNTTGVFTAAAGSSYTITAKNAAGCISVAATGTVNAQPATPSAPTVSVTQPTCATATATITVTSTLTGLTFSNDGTNYTNTTGVFTVAAGSSYSITAKNAAGCISTAVTGTVNAQPASPTAPTVSVMQPTCSTATATVTVTSSLTGLTFSNDGTTYTNTTGVFAGIAAGSSYSITAKNANGCISVAATGTVNVQPTAPASPVVSITQPTCSVASATITVTSAITGLSFSNDGTNYTNTTGVFTVAAGSSYSITAKNASGCISTAATGTTNAQPATPVTPTVSIVQPTCTTATASITVTSTGASSFTLVSDGTTFINSTGVFNNLAAGSAYSVTTTSSAGCVSSATAGTINAQPTAATVPTVSVTQPTCSVATATITVTSSLTGLTFSNDGTNYTNTTGVFTVTAGSSYSITAKNANGCISTAATGTIIAQPNAPFTPVVSVTQPTCTTANATVTVISGTTGLTFSNDGTTYTNTTGVFIVAAGSSYSITSKSASGCISSAVTGTVNGQPAQPAAPTVSITQPTCSVATATITVTSSLTGLTFSNDGTTYTNTTGVFTVAAGSSYSITSKTSAGCISLAATGTINAQPTVPTVAAITGTTTVCAGSTTALSSTTIAGVWTSGTTSVATVNSSTGEVTGVSGGTSTITYTISNGTCSNSATTTVTVNSYPVVAAIANNSALCIGSTNTVTNTTNAGTWTSNTTSVATINSSTGLITAIAAGTSTITYTVSNGTCSSTSNATLVVNPNGSWTGANNTVWTDAGNWCNGVPTTSSDATILATATNMPVLTGTQAVRNITVQSGASMTVTGTLQVAGNMTNNGTFTATAGTIEFNGTALQTVAIGATVKNVNINSTGGVVLANSMSVSGTFNSVAGNVDLNNYNITLLSSATATARIAPVTGTFTYGTGKFVQQRFVPAKPARTWSMVASSFNQSIAAAWQQQVHITGVGTGGTNCPSLLPHTNGFDATVTNSASMFIYDGSRITGTRWASVTGTSAVNLAAGTGYRMNIRGPRSMGCSLLDGTVLSTSDAIMASAGTLSNGDRNMGSFNITYSNNGNATAANDNFLMIGNPYPSEVSFAQLKADNSSAIGSSYAIYGPRNMVGNYAYWNGSTFTGGNTGLDDTKGDVIANGQAIFVKGSVPGANITLAFNEAQKTNIANNGYFRTQANPNMLRIGYMINNGNKADEIILQFVDGGTTEQLNDADIVSMNTGSQNLKSIKGTKEMAINTRPLNFINDTVSLNVASSSNGTFRLQFSGYAGFTGANIYLIDKYTNSIQYMNSNPDYYFTVNTNDSASKGANRFKVVFNKQAPTVPIVAVPDPIKVYPNPVKSMLNVQLPQVAGVYTLRLMDVRGRLVTEQKAAQGANTMNTANLITGVYMLEVINANGKKEIIKIIKE